MQGVITDKVVERVREAAHDAFVKHGELTTDHVRSCAILLREGGEAMNEALLATLPVVSETEYSRRINLLHDELAQVAATAMVMMGRLRGANDKPRT